jgi:hypothetical protein
LKLRTILQEQCFDEQFRGSPCVYQVSEVVYLTRVSYD